MLSKILMLLYCITAVGICAYFATIPGIVMFSFIATMLAQSIGSDLDNRYAEKQKESQDKYVEKWAVAAVSKAHKNFMCIISQHECLGDARVHTWTQNRNTTTKFIVEFVVVGLNKHGIIVYQS